MEIIRDNYIVIIGTGDTHHIRLIDADKIACVQRIPCRNHAGEITHNDYHIQLITSRDFYVHGEQNDCRELDDWIDGIVLARQPAQV